MKHQFKYIFFFSLLFFFSASTAIAQISISNNLGIFPGPFPFTGQQKFTSIGESGGAPGETETGCDLYGFRAQTSLSANINVGITTKTVPFGNTGLDITTRRPTILWGNQNKSLDFVSEGASTSGNNNAACGRRIANMRIPFSFSNIAFTVYGSSSAIGGSWQASDQRLKKDVSEIGNALEMLQNLRGVVYEYEKESYPELGLPEGRQYGFLAQEVAEVMPEAVQDAPKDETIEVEYKVMQYTQIIPVLTEAVKEQQIIINSQQDLLAQQLEIILALEERVDRLENPASSGTELPALDNAATISYKGVNLRQNRPNPFKGQTVIDYTVPSDMNNSQLVIYDLNGKALSSFNLEAGNGQVTLNAADLSSGVYFYAIENNGQTIARQKMIVK